MTECTKPMRADLLSLDHAGLRNLAKRIGVTREYLTDFAELGSEPEAEVTELLSV